ncbi:MAG: hypothetical protein OEW87_02020, partial [Flavobacteriaceae bacterium]|nr:hypothetical protein [Flavobacteriaceae bacterium]
TILDGLGNAGSEYRNGIYENGFSSEKGTITKTDLLSFLEISIKFLDHSIKANKRADKLYHSYNLMTVKSDSEISISYLPVMLEGQVAVLSSGYISGKDSLELLDALKSSALFREDQYSYILYPNKELLRFFKKNVIPENKVRSSALFTKLLKDRNTDIIEKDALGNYHFNGAFNNANSLKQALSQLPEGKYQQLVEKDKVLLLEIFEEVFDHKSFTGRSGTFYGYEGLGSIYWHMVSKLLLSVQETCLQAMADNESDVTVGRLLEHYYEIYEGIGVHKSPELYGAFPTDPYSHTPAGKGAQQPGMTGQVKEDVLCRFGELGVFVNDGKLYFNPRLLKIEEFLKEPAIFCYFDIYNKEKKIELDKNSLCFTYCQIPVIYKLSEKEGIQILYNKSTPLEINGLSLDKETSKKVFERTGEISQMIVSLKNL